MLSSTQKLPTYCFNLLLTSRVRMHVYAWVHVYVRIRVYACMCCPFVWLTAPVGWEIIHILSAASVFSESAAAMCVFGLFCANEQHRRFWAGHNAARWALPFRTPSPSAGMKRARVWEHPVIWWLSNIERERAWECTHTQRNEVKWDEQIVPLTAATRPHTAATLGVIFWWLLI